MKWWQLSAEQGVVEAQSNLGMMYGNGEGVPQNYIKAYMWTSLAKAQDDETAAKNLDIIKNDVTAADIS